jgi:hypothetical protein
MSNTTQSHLNAGTGALARCGTGVTFNLKKTMLAAAVGALALSSLVVGPASAKIVARVIVPDSEIHEPLGDNGPSGERATSGCRWSRLQVPTVMGLRWIAEESCDTDGN